jgi:hypothetical protein
MAKVKKPKMAKVKVPKVGKGPKGLKKGKGGSAFPDFLGKKKKKDDELK